MIKAPRGAALVRKSGFCGSGSAPTAEAVRVIGVRDNDLPTGFGETGLALWHFNTGPGAYERLPTFGTDGVAGFLGARATGFATWLPGTAVRLRGGVLAVAPALMGLAAWSRPRGRCNRAVHDLERPAPATVLATGKPACLREKVPDQCGRLRRIFDGRAVIDVLEHDEA